MNIGLYKIDDTLITPYLERAVPGYDTTKVINRLLQGQYHIQTIGSGARVVECYLGATRVAKDIIDLAESMAEPIKVVWFDQYYTGIIKEKPNWEYFNSNTYKTRLTILVLQEGTI